MKLQLLAVAVATAISTPAFAGEATSAKAGKGFKVNKEDVTFSVGGRLMYDLDYMNDDLNAGESGTDGEIRRARLFIKGQIAKDWEAKLQLNIKDSKSEANLEDAYLKYKGMDWADLTIGKHKEPFGLEENTSSKDISAIERTMATNAFAQGRNYGVSLANATKNFTWKVGLYDNGADESAAGSDTNYAFTGRMTYAPILDKKTVLHFGAGFTSRDVNEFEISERPEVHLTSNKVKSLAQDASGLDIYNLEAAFATGSFHVQGEYFDAEVDGANGFEDSSYDGYYLQAGYILTGESRPYKKGVFKRVKPKGDAGAWEIVGRFSNLNAMDNNAGEEGETTMIGLNYYANNAIRIGFNYVDADVKNAAGEKESGDALSVRFQYVF